MSFAEVLDAARELSADERADLIRELSQPLPPAFAAWAVSGQPLESPSPIFAPEAATRLQQLLDQERAAMSVAVTFPFRLITHPFPTRRPFLPIRLARGSVSFAVEALVDSGADVCILPYDVGLQLGLSWAQAIPLPAVGSALSSTPSRAALLTATVAAFPPVQLGFAWVQSNAAPVILGVTNFFLEFDVGFFAARNEFSVAPKGP